MTLKNRTVSPVARLFGDSARQLAKPLARREWLLRFEHSESVLCPIPTLAAVANG